MKNSIWEGCGSLGEYTVGGELGDPPQKKRILIRLVVHSKHKVLLLILLSFCVNFEKKCTPVAVVRKEMEGVCGGGGGRGVDPRLPGVVHANELFLITLALSSFTD